jgi:hypothetical protein
MGDGTEEAESLTGADHLQALSPYEDVRWEVSLAELLYRKWESTLAISHSEAGSAERFLTSDNLM